MNIGVAPLERLDTGSKESQSHTTNFVEEDIRNKNHDKKIIYLPMRNILNQWFSEEKNQNVYWQASAKLNEDLLNFHLFAYIHIYA